MATKKAKKPAAKKLHKKTLRSVTALKKPILYRPDPC